MNENKNIDSVIVGLALILSAVAFGLFFYFARTGSNNDTLAVTGSAKTRVTSDQARLAVSLTRTTIGGGLSAGYTSIAHDAEITKKLLKDAGFSDSDITENPVNMNQIYGPNGPTDQYQLNQSIVLQSKEVAKVTNVSKKIPSLAAQGAIASIQSLEYYYSKLPDLRVSLLTQAVQDAKARAAKIAEGTGRRVGDVQAASIGVVQVMSPNSVDVSDYGSYDTSSIDKDVMVTVKASFRLR